MNPIFTILASLESITPILALQSCFPWSNDFDISETLSVHHGDDTSIKVRDGLTGLTIWQVEHNEQHIRFCRTAQSDTPAQAQFESVLRACGVDDGQRHDPEALSERVDAVDRAWCLMRTLQQAGCADNAETAHRLLQLASDWSRNRLARFEATKPSQTLDAEADKLFLEIAAIDRNTIPALRNISLQQDPRGSSFTLRMHAPIHDREVQGANLNWMVPPLAAKSVKPATKVKDSSTRGPKPTKLPTAVLQALAQAQVDNRDIRVVERLQPPLFAKVKDVLEELGGRWSTSRQAFVYQDDPQAALQQVLASGQILTRRDYEFFRTPDNLVKQLLANAMLKPGMRVMEPNAGDGALALAAAAVVGHANVTCCELMPQNVRQLKALGFDIEGPKDFLEVVPRPQHDVVLMNTPFSGGKDRQHVLHALKFLKDGGELWAIISTSWKTAEHHGAREFREMLQAHALAVEDIPAGTFANVGTNVPTVLIGLRKPASTPVVVAPAPAPAAAAKAAESPARTEQMALF